MFLLRVLPNTAQILRLEEDEVYKVHLVLAFIVVDHNESEDTVSPGGSSERWKKSNCRTVSSNRTLDVKINLTFWDFIDSWFIFLVISAIKTFFVVKRIGKSAGLETPKAPRAGQKFVPADHAAQANPEAVKINVEDVNKDKKEVSGAKGMIF